MDEIRKLNVNRQINDVINTKNEFSTIHFHDLFFNAPVLVYREKSKWKNPYKFLNMKNESALLDLPNDSTKFKITSVKSYYDPANSGTNIDDQNISNATNSSDEIGHDLSENAADRIFENSPDNQSELAASIEPIIRDRGRSRKYSNEVELIFLVYVSFSMSQNRPI